MHKTSAVPQMPWKLWWCRGGSPAVPMPALAFPPAKKGVTCCVLWLTDVIELSLAVKAEVCSLFWEIWGQESTGNCCL